MDNTMVKFIVNQWLKLAKKAKNNTKVVITLFIITAGIFAYVKPQQFVDLWLTRDQQGQVLFNIGNYQQASTTFKSTHWQAYSSYGAQQYKNAATLYGQFTGIDSQIAKANALAHAREYVNARNLYQKILTLTPDNKAANTNIVIVQAIIDEVNRLSASQRAEQGESSKELGDEPQTGDGAERQEAPKGQEIEQLSAEELLLDPSLNEMWLRQVQKNPANFLSQKFYLQQEMKSQVPVNGKGDKSQGSDDE